MKAAPPRLGWRTGLKFAGLAAAMLAAIGLFVGHWFYGKLRGSLPQLEGEASLPGLTGPVTVERDNLGVPTIHANRLVDAARALGLLHGQDRFFQMDLARRRAAGELSELFGPSTLGLDQQVRPHEFRALAQGALQRASPELRQLLEAYAAGVNAGLSALQTKPFEYIVLRTKPEPWKAEDCELILYSMTLTLQDSSGRYVRSLATLWDVLGEKAFAFLAPAQGPDDAALDGSTAPLPPIPAAGELSLRPDAAKTAGTAGGDGPEPGAEAGSNAFAVSGAHTADGAAVLANDMHLSLAVPNLWYRAELVWGTHRLTGVTLPGTPFVVAGSNGHIAWGFTNACAGTGDLIILTLDSPQLYRGPGGEILTIEHRQTQIRVKGREPVPFGYDRTVWGPIIGTDPDQRPLVYHWSADDPPTSDIDLSRLANATSAGDAAAEAQRLGIPNVNFLVADDQGRIAWTVAGRLPKRVGYDGRLPVFWQYGDRKWDGYLAPAEAPAVTDADLLWSSNQRMLGGEAFTRLGDGGTASPARAAQVRDDLRALVARQPKAVAPADLLAIQLDDRALFLARWQRLALQVLTPAALAQHPGRAEFLAAVQNWGERASVDSAGYLLVRRFRLAVANLALGPIFAPCRAADPGFDWHSFHYEEPLWALLQAKPAYLLNPQYRTWDDLLLGAVDQLAGPAPGTNSARETWGERNTLAMDHPFSRLLPRILARWLNMPAEQLPGDDDMPRVQQPSFGASERFAVAPGREREGIFEMPGGESGHPLSPFYRAGHEAWVRGEPAPFLPGPPAHTLSLDP